MFDTLLELIEHGDPAFEQCVAIDGRLDSVWSPVEKTQSDRMLNLCDRLGDGRLRNRKLRGRFAHAARFRNGQKNVQIAQPEAFSNAVRPVHVLIPEWLWDDHRIELPVMIAFGYASGCDSLRAPAAHWCKPFWRLR